MENYNIFINNQQIDFDPQSLSISPPHRIESILTARGISNIKKELIIYFSIKINNCTITFNHNEKYNISFESNDGGWRKISMMIFDQKNMDMFKFYLEDRNDENYIINIMLNGRI